MSPDPRNPDLINPPLEEDENLERIVDPDEPVDPNSPREPGNPLPERAPGVDSPPPRKQSPGR